MSLQSNLMLGAAGFAAVFAARALKLPVLNNIAESGNQSVKKVALPLPHIGKAGDFGYEWAVIPAAIGYFLSK